MAASFGLKQVVLPDPIYHLEHDRSEQATRPLTELDQIPAFREMIESRRPHIANSENWGLADVNLPSFSMGHFDEPFKAVHAHSVGGLAPHRS